MTMNYPNIIDYKSLTNIYYHKFYDINIIERNYIYPFTYNMSNKTNYQNTKIQETNEKKSQITSRNNIEILNNNFIQLPNFENLILDAQGLPFIPFNT